MFRKIVGILVLTFVGLPSLVMMIWSIGLVRMVSSAELLSDLPVKLINDAPLIVDWGFEKFIKDPNAFEDLNTRIWTAAVASVDTNPRKLLEEIALFTWMEGDLKLALVRIGAILRQEYAPEEVNLNFGKLKISLGNPKVEVYIRSIFNELPACNELQMLVWKEMDQNSYDYSNGGKVIYIPACRPTEETISMVINKLNQSISTIPDEYIIFSDNSLVNRLIDQAKNIFYSLMFPLIVLLIGAVIIKWSVKSMLIWIGVYLLIGTLFAWTISILTIQAVDRMFKVGDWENWYGVISGLLEKFGSSINLISVIIGIVGIVLVGVAIILSRKDNYDEEELVFEEGKDIDNKSLDSGILNALPIKEESSNSSREAKTDNHNAAGTYRPFSSGDENKVQEIKS